MHPSQSEVIFYFNHFLHHTQGPVVPPLPPGGLRGDDDDDEDTYEEAEPYVADTTLSNTGP